MRGRNLYRALSREWGVTGTSPAARAAMRRWAEADAVLTRFDDPAALVRQCHRRDVDDHDALLAAVIRHAATDPLAARTVLQAMLPGFAALSRRLQRHAGPGRVWTEIDEIDQHVVSVGYERIHALAVDPPRWLAKALVDGTWQRVRWYALRRQVEAMQRTSLVGANDRPDTGTATPGEELAEVLADALELGVLDKVDAWVVFQSRVHRIAIPELAAGAGVGARWLWRRRERAEDELVSAGRSALQCLGPSAKAV